MDRRHRILPPPRISIIPIQKEIELKLRHALNDRLCAIITSGGMYSGGMKTQVGAKTKSEQIHRHPYKYPNINDVRIWQSGRVRGRGRLPSAPPTALTISSKDSL